ncbi:tellurite resistance TerB family protein [Pseudaminobacter sp. 19-2017]|uniref:Tellurite resistance TerB family protein n=1 Tax=Pseudaminobacter soli (ex Zhang et al. 2022) TaxID=2831468 RepID=A0A942E0W6_9HYPH|nr:tellurite resistance TerB family protein [Pseudaminobacter soli]MBS3648570.1 tellurite resistance TerB family protein [Pseudaminobacter soli]
MAKPGTQEALIYLMVVTSAADREMTDIELGRIGTVIRTWPVFEDFDQRRLIPVAQKCQRLLAENEGLERVLTTARAAIPPRLHDTAYSAAFEVACSDMEMRLEEVRILQLVQRHLDLDEETVAAIERAAKARHRSLT